MDQAALIRQLDQALSAGSSEALRALADTLGFAEPRRSATNLGLLQEVFGDSALLAGITLAAGKAADPDLALNNLERLTGTVPAETLRPVLADATAGTRLLTILGASPFLTGILCRDTSFFERLFGAGALLQGRSEEEMIEELRQTIPEGASFAELQRGLRQFKCREILRIGSRDLCGMADLVEVTGELSALAAAALQRACEICDRLLRSEYGEPRLDGEPEREPLFTIFGMGKFGGRELNFSSDIDLIYFYSSEKGMTTGIPSPNGEVKNRLHLHQYYIKLADQVTRALNQPTEDGFVFRVDLRLRPEGNSGELAYPLRSAEIYYESWGQSWERAAMLKARPVAGSKALGEELLKRLEPFIYRRFLDYGMVEDMKVMKQKIDHSLTREREGELNLKLGPGGIREIEFFIQALQLIYAGKHRPLRERNSLKALDLLLQEGLIKATDHGLLRRAYIFLRTVEHRIQVVQERQTHNLPVKSEEMAALARRCGFSDRDAFLETLAGHRKGVHGLFRELFYSGEEEIRAEVRPEVTFLFDPASDVDLAKDLLEEKGFKNPDAAYETMLILRDGPPHAHLTQRARRHLERIAPLLLQEVIDSPEPDMALFNLERFLGALRARGTFYALLAENSKILKVLVSLFGSSQFLSRIFIQHPEILDSLVSRSYAVAFKEREVMARELADLLRGAGDYESRLDLLRRFRKEEFLRIAMTDLHGENAQEAGTRQLSYLADVCLEQAVTIARDELLPRFGLPWCSEHEASFAVVGMGKLGGLELSFHSDLDIIFIYEGEGETRPATGTDPDRFRQQTNHEYFSRLAQRIISVLTVPTREGTVYQIDTRLRPSGNQGPLVTSLPAFERYHLDSAQPWERQALAKARVVVGPKEPRLRIEALIGAIVYDRPLPEDLGREIYRLRQRMEQEIAREREDTFNIKTGRGGLVDVEFLAQYLQLKHGQDHPALRLTNTLETLAALRRENLLGEDDFLTLDGGYRFLRRLEYLLRILHDHSISEISADRAYLTKLARSMGYPDRPRRPDQAFLEDYRRMTEGIRAIFNRYLAPPEA